MASAATVEDTTFSDLAARQRHPAVDATIKIVQSPVGLGSGIVIMILIAVALAAPYVSPFDPQAISRDKFVAPGEAGHWLGSDGIGRDILTRIMYGRADLAVRRVPDGRVRHAGRRGHRAVLRLRRRLDRPGHPACGGRHPVVPGHPAGDGHRQRDRALDDERRARHRPLSWR